MGKRAHKYRADIGAFMESKGGDRLFRVAGHLGAGGMGEVLDVEDWKLGRRLALKVMLKKWLNCAEARECFEREGRLLARLKHPNIVHVHDIGEMRDGTPWILMDRLDGETVREALDYGGPFTLREILKLGRHTALTLHHLHWQSLTHLDIKPSNIFLVNSPDGDPFPVLIDLGLFRRIGAHEKPAPGTFPYASPEQKRGDPNIGWASDIYSLALTIYVMLLGRLPRFSSDGTPEPIGHLIGNSVAGKMLDDLLPRMLAPNPPRPSSLDVSRELEKIQIVLEYRPAQQRSWTEKFMLSLTADQPVISDEDLQPRVRPPSHLFITNEVTTRPFVSEPPQPRDRSSHSSRTPSSPAIVASAAILAGSSGLAIPVTSVPAAPPVSVEPVPVAPVVVVGGGSPSNTNDRSSTPSASSAQRSVSHMRARPAPRVQQAERNPGKMSILPWSKESIEATKVLTALIDANPPPFLRDDVLPLQPKDRADPKVQATTAPAADHSLSKDTILFVAAGVTVVVGVLAALSIYFYLKPPTPDVSIPAPSATLLVPPAPVPSAPPTTPSSPASPTMSVLPPTPRARPPSPAPTRSERGDGHRGLSL